MAVLHLTKENFNETILNAEKPVLVDFWAPWCPPCRMLGPVIEELGESVGDDAIIAKVNVDEEKDLATTYGIISIPTIIIFKGNKIVDKFFGFANKEKILSLINSHK